MSLVSYSLGPEISFDLTIAYLFSLQLGTSPRCHGVIPAALMLALLMLVPNMTKPPSFRLEASGGAIAVRRRHMRQRGKLKKTDGIKSKGGRKGRRGKKVITPE